jgi:dolichyl-diphosphooligosaccharide--protein glycosyltransferase
MTPDARLPERPDAATVTEWVVRNAHLAAVLALTAYMAWTRLDGWGRFVRDGRVLFRGNDAWYHYRQVSYTVAQFPRTIPFDPWTAYPRGIAVGQFGTIFDQTVALAALVVGFGDPDAGTVGLTLLFAPAVLGVLAVVPTYLLGRHFAGRAGGVAAVTVLALTPGAFLQRTMVGFADHHAAETLLQATAMLAVVTAVRAAERHEPVAEGTAAVRARVRKQDLDGLRRPLLTALLSGVAVAGYVLVWPPGAVLGLVLAVFYAVHMSAEFVRGRPLDDVALVGDVSALTTAVVLCGGVSSAGFDPIAVSLLQPALFVLLATGIAGVVALGRAFERSGAPRRYFPLALAGLGVALAVAVRVVAPARFDFFTSYLLRVFGYALAPEGGAVSETRRVAFDSILPFLELSYGLAFALALAGVGIATVEYLRSEQSRGSVPALVVWLGFLTTATLTQIRFDYYLVVPVAVASAIAVARVVGRARLGAPSDLTEFRWRRGAAVAAVALVLVGPFVSSAGAGGVTMEATAASTDWGPGEVTEWRDSLDWMRTNTPEEGTYGESGGALLPYYPTVAPTDDYDYPPGAYGVLTWWDAGHFVTALGERIPVANPFQEGRAAAAGFFLARDEATATDRVTWGDERVRYVLVDWSLAVPGVGRYAAPLDHANGTRRLGEFVRPVYLSDARGQGFAGYIKRRAHYESLRVRLFRYHASARSPRPVVTDWETRPYETAGGEPVERAVVRSDATFVRRFDSLAAAREFVREDGSAQVGGVDGLPPERVPALEHYRLVHVSDTRYETSTISGTRRGHAVKTFERVPGATVRGRAPPNATVTASVELAPANGTAFTYTQRAQTGPDGRFSMTLPYSTRGYDAWGTKEGYTNVSVRATGPYEFSVDGGAEGQAGARSVHVPERTVVLPDSTPVNVTLAPS